MAKINTYHKICIFFLFLYIISPYKALAQNNNTQSLKLKENITQEHRPIQEKINYLSAFGSASFPIYDLQRKDILEIIAHTQASLYAFKNAAQNLKNHTLAFKSAPEAAQRFILAAYIFNSTSKTSITTEKTKINNNKILSVVVKLDSDSNNLDAKINKMLQIPEFFILCESILRSLANLSKEATHLINSVNTSNNKQYKGSNYVLWERISHLTYNIETLWEFFKLLPNLEHTWKKPKEMHRAIELLLQKAPSDALLWTALGEVQLQQDLPQDALSSFNKALLIEPQLARTLHSRGLAHLRLQHLALAEKDISDALEIYPDIISWLRSRGAVYMLREKNNLMCIDFQRACALGDCDGLKLARKKKLCLKLQQ